MRANTHSECCRAAASNDSRAERERELIGLRAKQLGERRVDIEVRVAQIVQGERVRHRACGASRESEQSRE